MARRSDPSRVAFWRGLIQRRRGSGCSVAELCEQAGVSPASFYQWQRKLRDQQTPAARKRESNRGASRLVPVRIIADPPTGESAGALEIDLPGGIRLRIPAGCDRAMLQFVLSLLLESVEAEGGSC